MFASASRRATVTRVSLVSSANVFLPPALGVFAMTVSSPKSDLVDQVMTRSLRSFERNKCPLRVSTQTDIKKTYHYRNYVAFTNKVDTIARKAKWPSVILLAFVDYCTSQVVSRKLIKYGLGSLIQDTFLAECKLKFERMRQELIETKKAIELSVRILNEKWKSSTTKYLPLDKFLASPRVGLANITKFHRNGTVDEITLACHKACRSAIEYVRQNDAVQDEMLPSTQKLDSIVERAKRRLGQQLLTELFGEQLYS